MTDRRPALFSSLLACGLLVLAAHAALGQVKPERTDDLSRLTVSGGRLAVRGSVAALADGPAAPALPEVRDGWAAFQLGTPGEWRGYVDRRTGLLAAAEGAGLPWIPGRGNRLTRNDIASFLDGQAEVSLGTLEKIARGFLGRTAKLLGVDPAALVLNRGRSGPLADYLWSVDFDLVRDGRTVEGTRVTFLVNNGNLVQFGSTAVPSPGAAVPAVPAAGLDLAGAKAILANHVGGFGKGDHFADPGSLHLLPAEATDGRGLLLVWSFAFRRDGTQGTWRGRIDAATGELLAFEDVARYAQTSGGVYPESYATDAETVRPMPFSYLSSGVFTDSSGSYDFLGGAVTGYLIGPFVYIGDYCGGAVESANGGGNIFWGTSSGTDCATPSSGGPGNTHAARMQFYHVNRIMESGRGWLPNNSWLESQVPVYVNVPLVCNAFWSSYYGSLNFFRSGGGCGNTGEITGVSLHEFGHGLDQNDGNGPSPDGGSRESYADVTATLVTHDSCSGRGFFQAQNCTGYGDACNACSGVRDLDWAHHASGAPHTVANFTQTLCPVGFGDDGPCGMEAHCESYLPSEAIWDLAVRDLPGGGSAATWSTVERLWYRSRVAAGSAFTCNTAPATWTSDGCAAGSLWRVLRAADDDDGNLANGTPHSCAIYAALARHGLACPGDPGAQTCFSGCTPPAAPSATLTPGHRQVRFDFADPGTGVVYDLYRNETSCNGGFARVASGLVGTAYLDTAVADGMPYNYQLVARPVGNEACVSAPSACQSAVPVAPACGLAAPATLTATAASPHKVSLAWSTVPGATDYDIFRAATSGGPYTQVQTVPATTTTWTDSSLASGQTAYYVVRAAALCESANSPQAAGTSFLCQGTALYSNDFESGSGLGDWTTGAIGNAPRSEWRGIQACPAHGGQKVFHFGGPGCTDPYDTNQNAYAQVGGAAGIAVPVEAAETRLSFWHRWGFESCCDGGNLALAVDGGSFVNLPANLYLAGFPNNSAGRFTDTQASFVNSIVDLDAACNLAIGGSGGSGGTGGCGGHTLYLRFVAQSDSSINDLGWFLDDVVVSACLPHGCTGAPVAGAATTPANNQVQLTWANGAPPSASFDVYRAVGTCAAPGPFSRIATQTAGSPFLDTTASGTVPYAYRITGLEGTGQCESDPSGCLQATATGPCTGAPQFAGLASAGNGAIDLCSANLSWTAATALCGGPVTYNVYRGTAPGFTPGAGNRIASGINRTTFADLGPLTNGTTYFYVVRAVDGANGAEDGNLVVKSATPTGPISTSTLTDTFEGSASGGGFDRAGWNHSALSGPTDWAWSTSQVQSPTHSWFSASLANSAGDRVLVSPSFGVVAGTTVSFWHSYAFYSCYDGGILEISTDGGASWSPLPESAYTVGGPPYFLFQSPNPLSGVLAWCSGFLDTPTQVIADLSAYAGSPARLRWHAGDSGYSGFSGYGWYVDSVLIGPTQTATQCSSTPPPPLKLYTVAPCRLVDTRNPTGPLGGPALPPTGQRTFTLTGVCNIPATAKALSVNLTVVAPAAAGDLRLFPADRNAPLASAINFNAARTRTSNAILGIAANGALIVQNDAVGGVHLVLDVNGYFQ